MTDPQYVRTIELAVSDPSEFRSLREWLAQVPGIELGQIPAPPMLGELGAIDILVILCSSGRAFTIAVRALPEFIRSRRSDLTITANVDGREFTLQASNLADVNAVIDRLTNG